jgi:hypothetical protein
LRCGIRRHLLPDLPSAAPFFSSARFLMVMPTMDGEQSVVNASIVIAIMFEMQT